MNRKVTFRLYPKPSQEWGLWRMLHLHQQLYNAALEQRIEAWKLQRKTVGFFEQCRNLTDLRADDPQYRALNCQSSQVTLKRVDLAFRHFFRRVRKASLREKGFPRFKAVQRFAGWGYKHQGDGWRLHTNGERFHHGKLYLSGIGFISIRGKSRTPGEPKTMEIQRKDDRWYASVTIECSPKRVGGAQAIGIDWGVKTFASLAFDDGHFEEIQNPLYLTKSMAELKIAQKDLSRKKRNSRNSNKTRQRVATLHRKIRNRRHNFLHQQSASIVAKSSLIATEILSVRNMTRSAKGTVKGPGKNVKQKAGLNQSILDTAPSRFFLLLQTKAEEAAVKFVKVPTRSVKPSQTCSQCGVQRKKDLSERTHECQSCGLVLDRDKNAARVILDYALAGQEPASRGEDVVLSSLKRETPSVASARWE